MCEKCGKELIIGEWPFCPHGMGNSNVIGDECDVTIRHGLCWDNGEPRRFTSKIEMAKVAKEKGLVNIVEHVPRKGSDKSPHTTKWY